ncbi:HAD-IA family hydrolase [Aeromonas hydrophila]|uniref:HAD-IA family hydrolase n=1 Tax=Aeromonas hydrophila TaxID=644 RepID=UPI0023661EC5|nr:HAD-IA family hydrolase [Aeromonas hydrophila]WDF89773.1 HAD-IA family hydrolase [Aeromonas hydrophila subsp. hydrophila]
MSLSQRMSALQAALSDPDLHVISCDVFDTLIFREAGSPESLWRALGREAYRQGLFDDDDSEAFVVRRQSAEKAARERQQVLAGHTEVTLEQIYACWPSSQGEALTALEQVHEYADWRINGALVTALHEQQQKGRRLILISDMYLPATLIARFMGEYAPMLSFDAIYVSGEQGVSKRSGLLYARVLESLSCPPTRVLHIGDDRITDHQMAQAVGLRCFPVPLGEAYLAQVKHEQRLYSLDMPGLERVRRLWPWYSQGAMLSELAGRVYGPIIFGFARWVAHRCERLGIRTLYCLLREGELIASLIRLCGVPDLRVETLHVSRRSTLLPSLAVWHSGCLAQLVQRRGYTLHELMEDLGQRCPAFCASRLQETLFELAAQPCWNEIVTWLDQQQAAIETHLAQQRDLTCEYLRQQGVRNTPDVAILDWGCGGSLLRNLHKLVELDETSGFMFYSSRRAMDVALQQKLHVFQPAAAREWSAVLAAYPEINEILLNGTLCSTRSYTYAEAGIYPLPVQPPEQMPWQQEALQDFAREVMAWAHLASETGWLVCEPSVDERHYLFGALYRLVQYPTWQEADSLAWLPVPLSAGKSRALLNSAQIDALRELAEDGERALLLGRDGVHPITRSEPWFPGLVAQAFPGQLQTLGELSCLQDDDKVAPGLLAQLQRQEITKTALYGAGALGLGVYSLLRQHGIIITHVVDRRAEATSFTLGEHEVITLAEALVQGVTCFTVASRAFAMEIEAQIRAAYTTAGVSPKVIAFGLCAPKPSRQ